MFCDTPEFSPAHLDSIAESLVTGEPGNLSCRARQPRRVILPEFDLGCRLAAPGSKARQLAASPGSALFGGVECVNLSACLELL